MREKMQNQPRPEPTAAFLELIRSIADNGCVTVAEFMEVAAGHYYAARDPFGADGDFTTAPEISQMFGEMIGAWVVDGWMQLGKPEFARLIELGPGRGTLAADVMRTISAWPDCKAAFQLHLVENSPLLRRHQAEVLKGYDPVWHEKLEEVPPGVSFILANEFFDALPIHQYIMVNGEWHERCIGFDRMKDSFFFMTQPYEGPQLPPAPEAAIIEKSPASLAAMDQIVTLLDESGGAALLIDYGYDQLGFGDTLQTLRRHAFTDVLENPGGDDITAHVDFVSLKERAARRLDVHGPAEQGVFLLNLGIAQRAEALQGKASEKQLEDIQKAFHRLTSPDEMGSLFKVLGLTRKGDTIKPAGFDAPHPLSEEQEE